MKRLPALTALVGLGLTGCGTQLSTPSKALPAASPTEQTSTTGYPPAMQITTIKQLRDRSRVVVLATVTGATTADTSAPWQSEAGAESTPMRVDEILWGSLATISSGQQFTLSRYFSDPSPLAPGRQYLVFLKMGGPEPHIDYVIPNQIFGIDGTDYVHESPYLGFPGRRDRQQTDQEIRG